LALKIPAILLVSYSRIEQFQPKSVHVKWEFFRGSYGILKMADFRVMLQKGDWPKNAYIYLLLMYNIALLLAFYLNSKN